MDYVEPENRIEDQTSRSLVQSHAIPSGAPKSVPSLIDEIMKPTARIASVEVHALSLALIDDTAEPTLPARMAGMEVRDAGNQIESIVASIQSVAPTVNKQSRKKRPSPKDTQSALLNCEIQLTSSMSDA